MGTIFTLLALIAPNFLNLRSRTSINTTITALTTDLKNQQIKAMTGDTEGRGVPDNYGIYIQPDQYILFRGVNFSPSELSNFPINIDEQYILSTTFANSKIVFEQKSGEIVNFVDGQNSVVIRDPRTGDQKTLLINKYGTVTGEN